MSATPGVSTPLRLGHMPYANSLVFYSRMARDAAELITLPPRNMADAMRRGELDAGPLPIYEVLNLGDTVVPVGDFGVATDGAAHSVLLFSEVSCDTLSGSDIAVTAHTSTSIQLLRILMADLWDVGDVDFVGPDEECDARLLIGDAALEFRRERTAERERYRHVYDLAEEWKMLTGHPFVFARWVARRDTDTERLFALLRDSFEHGLGRIDELAASVSIPGFAADDIADYVRNFTYRLGDAEFNAVEEFRIRLEKLPVWEPPVMPYVTDNHPATEAMVR